MASRLRIFRASALASILVAVASASVAPVASTSTAAAGSARSATGKVFLSVEEALAMAFPGCELTRSTIYLTSAQRARATKLAGEDVGTAIARPWVALREGKLVGTAYLDTHKVRTLAETVFVVVDPECRITRLEVLAFAEPQEYLPRGTWYAQFTGRVLDDSLRVKGAIRPVTGASLTASATTSAARRVLALHAALRETPPQH